MSHSTVPRSRAEADTSEETPVAPGDATGPRPAADGRAGKLSLRLRLRRDRTLILMTLPAVLLIVVFNYIPILGNVVAFQDYDPYLSENGFVAIFQSPWIGLEQFERIFADSAFWHAVQNTFVLFFLQLVLFFPIPILLALLINSIVSGNSSDLRSPIRVGIFDQISQVFVSFSHCLTTPRAFWSIVPRAFWLNYCCAFCTFLWLFYSPLTGASRNPNPAAPLFSHMSSFSICIACSRRIGGMT